MGPCPRDGVLAWSCVGVTMCWADGVFAWSWVGGNVQEVVGRMICLWDCVLGFYIMVSFTPLPNPLSLSLSHSFATLLCIVLREACSKPCPCIGQPEYTAHRAESTHTHTRLRDRASLDMTRTRSPQSSVRSLTTDVFQRLISLSTCPPLHTYIHPHGHMYKHPHRHMYRG